MKFLPRPGTRCMFALAVLIACSSAHARVDPEDQKLIDAADCGELLQELRDYSAAEKKVADEIKRSGNATTAYNVFGVATMATLGIGFFSWNDNADAKENLAELTAYRLAIEAAARRKNCKPL
jgi:hypothetical protein